MPIQPPPVLVDVTELVTQPHRTGIQRVVRAALRYWPRTRPLLPCRFDAALNALVPLPQRAVALLTEADPVFRALPVEVLKAELQAALAAAPQRPVDTDLHARIFVPELFFDPVRAQFYRRLLARHPDGAAFLVYDFIPWLRPDLLQVDRTHPLMPYLAVLGAARRLAFISKATQAACAGRILRRAPVDGVVLPLGADALLADGLMPRQNFRPDRQVFVAIGSIDGRKNQDLMAVAFAQLRAEGVPVRLVVVGGVFDNRRAQAQAAAVQAAAAADPDGIRYVPDAADTDVAALLATARATLYLSDAEGYGLPPVEGLAAGVPAIVGGEVPSVTELPSRGWIRLPTLNVEALAEAVRQLVADDRAAALWADTATLTLPSWRGFAAAAAEWISRDPVAYASAASRQGAATL